MAETGSLPNYGKRAMLDGSANIKEKVNTPTSKAILLTLPVGVLPNLSNR